MLLWHTSTANDNNPTGRQPNARAVERRQSEETMQTASQMMAAKRAAKKESSIKNTPAKISATNAPTVTSWQTSPQFTR